MHPSLILRACYAQLLGGLLVASLSLPAVAGEPQQPDTPHTVIELLRSVFSRSSNDADWKATHRQTSILQVVDGKNPEASKLASFCLSPEGNILTALTGTEGEVRLLSPDGERLGGWTIPVQPEAINVGPENTILLAGQGRILVLDSDGGILKQADAPHTATLKQNLDSIRREVTQQHLQSIKAMERQVEYFKRSAQALLDSKLTPAEREEHALLRRAVADLEGRPAEELPPREERALKLRKELLAAIQESLEWRLNDLERGQQKMYAEQIKFARDYLASKQSKAPSESEIDALVERSIQYKSQVASISSDGKRIYLATGASKGYGFDVWSVDLELSDARQMVKGLRGCCGQMDVQSNANGIFVAENSRHRVRHYDRDGNHVADWGRSDTSSVEGFGGCCNPMNLAFGADGCVYTAESTSGRIKKYSLEGKLQALIGSVTLVPGCKKVSIAVSQDCSRVYMLDITRGHIVLMQAHAPAVQEPAVPKEALETSTSGA